MLNEVAWSEVADDDAECIIDEVIATYRAHGKPVKWCVGPWTKPAGFGERLTRRGFSNWGVRGMGAATDDVLAGQPNPEIRVVRVVPSDIDAYIETDRRSWPLPKNPELVARHRASLIRSLETEPERVQLFAATLADEWIGTSGFVLRDGCGYLLGAQVVPEARGRGAYRALVAHRLEALRALGIPYAVTQAREATSAPILERLGFETLFRSKCYLLDTRDITE
jgi:GNAT superfamily N-acetyltransferase